MSAPKDLADTNVFGIGSDQDIAIKVEAAKSIEAFKTAGKKEGVEVWRIEKFRVKKWPLHRYGSFYDGDSYIILHTYKKGDKLLYDVFFWLGRDSTQDEKGSAAYLTVSLDTLLNGIPVQHREVQGFESDKFTGLFKGGVKIMKGGIESGFNKVKPTEYIPRLFQVKGKTLIRVTEVKKSGDSLNSGDAFVLDGGLKIFRWCGSESSRAEQYSAMVYAESLKSDRGGKPTFEDCDEAANEDFWKIIGGKPSKIKSAEEGGDDKKSQSKKAPISMWKLSDETGKMTFTKVGETILKKSDLDTNDIFIVDLGFVVYIWVGLKANESERKYSMFYAMNYLKNLNRENTRIVRCMEGVEPSVLTGQLN